MLEMGRRVMVAGTFDIIHEGHIKMLWSAKSLAGDDGELVVVVARDENVRKYKKREPILEESIRAYIVKNLKPVDRVVLGERDPIESVLKLRPDVIALGYDQWADENWLREELLKRGLNVEIVRLPRFGDSSSSSIVRRVIKLFCSSE
ncbi:cytidyltransferase-related domain protein [Candidatus Korarchaeum cryptofilum OPF8]|uniref:FAD synthase n=2 Tax=Candidatus Korarchaeum cryptofilum TaxID=498846 RepID=RIBL_KORCO|nr:RecName: Full=FAD synthase; AltName: Full=FMN adenylyltransferase; AltName: Full=Flavin adenine dinucleotide synthase [Candidatus Korarchaeum cryptofilum OPF8]ACB06825.1 cytidyltransferase-related domain protein [Candidatus Korarchaeum cryptofilum OPF8]